MIDFDPGKETDWTAVRDAATGWCHGKPEGWKDPTPVPVSCGALAVLADCAVALKDMHGLIHNPPPPSGFGVDVITHRERAEAGIRGMEIGAFSDLVSALRLTGHLAEGEDPCTTIGRWWESPETRAIFFFRRLP